MSIELELLYFDLPGQAESIRLAANHANIPFSDVRISTEEFAALKNSGVLPFDQLPALRILIPDGRVEYLVQPTAILRFIARMVPESGLYAEDPLIAGQIDAVLAAEHDMLQGLMCSKYQDQFGFSCLGGASAPGTLAVRRTLNNEVLPRHLGHLERLMALSNTGWIANTEFPTIADFKIAITLHELNSKPIQGIKPGLVTPYLGLMGLIGKMMILPSVKEWHSNYPINASARQLP